MVGPSLYIYIYTYICIYTYVYISGTERPTSPARLVAVTRGGFTDEGLVEGSELTDVLWLCRCVRVVGSAASDIATTDPLSLDRRRFAIPLAVPKPQTLSPTP